ncbi:right-handed parallel beta-helix repeat-containing protein [bacterium]|nr:right-handed parallel beta-helix repeat-containing protein [bacterium]
MRGGNMITLGGFRRLLATALLFVLLVGSAGAVEYYVRTDGNDANPGTANTPAGAWATIGHLRFAGLSPGDVVNVQPGTYDENATYVFFTAGITIRGTTPTRPVLRRISLDFGDNADNVRLENLDINNAETHINVIQLRTGVSGFTMVGCDVRNPLNQNDPDGTRNHGCVTVEQANDVLFDTCRFIYNPQAAPTTGRSYNVSTHDQQTPSNNWTFRNCYFSMNPAVPSTAGGNLIFWTGVANLTVENCTFAWSPREHIGISNQSAVAPVYNQANWLIRNNQFLGTSATASLGVGYPHNIINWRIEDNYFTGSADQAIYFWSGPTIAASVVDGFVVSGNTFYNVGRGTSVFTDGAIMFDNVALVPTGGRQVLFSNNTFRDDRGGAHGGWGIFVRANGPGPIISDNHFDHWREACVLVGGSPWNLVGDRLTGLVNPVVTGNTVDGNTYGGVIVRYEFTTNALGGAGFVQNALIDNNSIQGCSQYGVSVETSNAQGTIVRNNDMIQCGAGVHAAGPTTIRGNEILGTLSPLRGGVWLAPYAVDTDVSNSFVSFNLTTGCAGYGVHVDPALTTRATNVRVFNNTVVANSPNGIRIGVDNLAVYNNIVGYHTGSGIVFAATTVGIIGYNLSYNTFSGGQNFSGFPGPTTFPGDIVGQDPLFVDFFGLDFHLQPTSPAIGAAGVHTGASLIPGGGDMGAYPSGIVSAAVRQAAWELYR